MAIEVEHRGIIPKKDFKKIKAFFDKNAKFIEEKDRFSVIYFQSRVVRAKDAVGDAIDLKVRITNKKAELAMKHGKWGGKDARREFLFPIEKEKFDEMVDFLKILGWTHGITMATKTFVYKYKEIEFALVEVPKWGYYFEAEILADENTAKEADEKLEAECKKIGLKLITDEEFYVMIDEINSLPGMRFDFDKQDFKDIKKRFLDFF